MKILGSSKSRERNLQICAQIDAGFTYTDIGKRYGISSAAVGEIYRKYLLDVHKQYWLYRPGTVRLIHRLEDAICEIQRYPATPELDELQQQYLNLYEIFSEGHSHPRWESSIGGRNSKNAMILEDFKL